MAKKLIEECTLRCTDQDTVTKAEPRVKKMNTKEYGAVAEHIDLAVENAAETQLFDMLILNSMHNLKSQQH